MLTATAPSTKTFSHSGAVQNLPATSSAQLILLIRDGKGERGVLLNQSSYTVGRAPSSNIRLFDGRVSRCHARLSAVTVGQDSELRYLLSDEGTHTQHSSSNGTYINGESVKIRMLKVGDRINFGPNTWAMLETVERIGKEITERLLTVDQCLQSSTRGLVEQGVCKTLF